MKNIINRILNGDFQPETGILDFSCAKIDLEMCPGKDYEGSFHIYGPPGLPTEGFIYSDNLCLDLYTHEFAGKESEIGFCLNPGKSNPGDVISGEITIVSNHGEYTIPYRFSIIANEISSNLGPIKNLFHFTNLAKTNWGEALNLFYSPAFSELLKGTDKQYMTIYRGLSGEDSRKTIKTNNKNEQNMEEFLQVIKKKQKIEYITSETAIEIQATDEPLEYQLSLTRNGWGYTDLHCRMVGNFLVCDKGVIRDEDYLANIYKLPYYIDADKLHPGNNFGAIKLYNAYTDITIPVTVVKNSKKSSNRSRDYKRNIYDLVNYYIAFRTKQINQTTWRKETEAIIDKMISASDNDLLPKLFRIQLLITENRINEASRLLNHADNLLAGNESKMPEFWCYYLYLTTLENRDANLTSRVTLEVERFYRRSQGSWRIGWLLCYLKEEYVGNPAKKWLFLHELIGKGKASPVIFIEAWQLLKQNPELLTRLDDFEIRLLLFAARRKLIPKNLIHQIVYLAGKSKVYTDFLYKILEACYEVSNSNEVVQAICELLIKGEKAGPKYYNWFLNGVTRDIKVTRLYDYFIFSLDQAKEDEIPKQVLLYFAYKNEVDYRYQAYIYAFVHKNRDLYPDIYLSYVGKIERFVVTQLTRARTGKWLAYLYKNFVTKDMINTDNVNGLADILFTNRIEILRENIREIIVLYNKSNLEIISRVSGKINNILLYGTEYQIFLIDSEGNRYVEPENYVLTKWLVPDKIGRMIAPMVRERNGFDLWVCEQGDDILAVNRNTLAAYERMYAAKYLKSPYREVLSLNLIRYYFEFEEMEALEKILRMLKPEDIDRRYHEEILKILTARRLYTEAYVWLTKINAQILDTKLILRILRQIIPDEAVIADRIILNLAFQSFMAAKYDEKLLDYLIRYYTGGTRKLRDIWQAGKSFGLDTVSLAERLLTQIIYSGAYISEQMEIFRDYVAGGGRNDVIRAFVIQNAYEYFANDKVTDITIVRQMEKILENGEPLEMVCRLAYAKYFAENKYEIDENTCYHLSLFMQNFLENNICFAFFKEYIGILPLMDQFLDKTIIEYHSQPGSRIFIHYTNNDSDYIIEPMTEMYQGIFVKEFLLFYGDSINYYVAEEENGQENYTQSGRLVAQDVSDVLATSRYSRINDIELARQVGDYETVNSLLADFEQLDFMVNELFEGVK